MDIEETIEKKREKKDNDANSSISRNDFTNINN